MLGHLEREMYANKLWPLPSVDSIRISTKALYRIMKGLQKARESTTYTESHVQCVLDLEPEGGFDSYQVVSNTEDKMHLTRQGELTGLLALKE